MNIVYLIRFDVESIPNMYIGSKTNCVVKDGQIHGNRGVYLTSSKDKQLRELFDRGTPYTILILAELESHEETIKFERAAHIANDVVASPKFFNKAIACENSYSNPDYATYKHSITGKVARLMRNHASVISGEWVGVTKGRILLPEEKVKRSMPGTCNPFYGKKHTEETKQKLKSVNRPKGSEWHASLSEEGKKNHHRAVTREKSQEHKSKIGRKGMIMLQNSETREFIRIKKEDSLLLGPEWVSPKKLTPDRRDACTVCGLISISTNIKRWHNEKCRHKVN